MFFKIFSFKSVFISSLGIIMFNEKSITQELLLKGITPVFSRSNIISKIANSTTPSPTSTPNGSPKISHSSKSIGSTNSISKTPRVNHENLTISPNSQIHSKGVENGITPSIDYGPTAISIPHPNSQGATANITLKTSTLTEPIFKNYNELKKTMSVANYIIAGIDLRPRISAYYNPAKKQILVSGPSDSYLGSLSESLVSHFVDFWVIGNETIARKNIIFSKNFVTKKTNQRPLSFRSSSGEQAVLETSQRDTKFIEVSNSKSKDSNFLTDLKSGNEKFIELTDLALYSLPLEAFEDWWVPIMISLGKQPYNPNMFPMIPDMHLFKGISIYNGLAKENFIIEGVTATFENFGIHAISNRYFLKNLFPFKITRPIHSELKSIIPFANKASLMELNLSEKSNPHLGELIIVAELRTNQQGIINKLFVQNYSRFADFLRASTGVLVKIGDHTVSKIKFSSDGESMLGKTLKSIIKARPEGYDLAKNNPWSLNNLFKWNTVENPNPLKTNGIITILEYSNTGQYRNLATPFFPVFEEFEIFVESISLGRSMFLTVDVSGKPVSKFVPFIPSKRPLLESQALTNTYESFTAKPYSFVLARSGNNLSQTPVESNIVLSPVFESFNELSIISERLFLDIHQLAPSESTFVRFSPVALYHPRENRVAILEQSIFGNLYTNFQRYSSNEPNILKFTNGFEPPKINLYPHDKFHSLFGRQNTISLLEPSSFKKSPEFLQTDQWNLIFIELMGSLNNLSKSITVGLYEEITIFKSMFTQSFESAGKKWSYELLTKKSDIIVLPIFDSYSDLSLSTSTIKWALDIEWSNPIYVSAFYNYYRNAVIVSNEKTSHLGVMLKSLRSHRHSYLTIGSMRLYPKDITFVKGDALAHLLSKSEPVIHLEDISLFNKSIDAHGDKWVPLMLGLGKQQNNNFPIPPDIHLYDQTIIFGDIGKDVFNSVKLGLKNVVLENYTNHIIKNPYFLTEISPIKAPRNLYSNAYEMKTFLKQMSLMKFNLSNQAKSFLGKFIVSGAFEYTPNGISNNFIVLENSNLANLIKRNNVSAVVLDGIHMNITFLNSKSKTLERFAFSGASDLSLPAKNTSSSWSAYSFNYLQSSKLKGNPIYSFMEPAIFEHSSIERHSALSHYDFPVYLVFENLDILSENITKQSFSFNADIMGASKYRTVTYFSKNTSVFKDNTSLALPQSLPADNLMLTPIFRDFNELSKKSLLNLNSKASRFLKRYPFAEITPVALYNHSRPRGYLGLIKDNNVQNAFASKLTLRDPESMTPIFMRNEFFSNHQFSELLEHNPISYFINLDSREYHLTQTSTLYGKWFPIAVSVKFPKKFNLSFPTVLVLFEDFFVFQG